jgi:hypothetical protein
MNESFSPLDQEKQLSNEQLAPDILQWARQQLKTWMFALESSCKSSAGERCLVRGCHANANPCRVLGWRAFLPGIVSRQLVGVF